MNLLRTIPLHLAIAALVSLAALIPEASEAAEGEPPWTVRGGDVSPQNFASFCAGPLPAERVARFERMLGDAEAALARRDLKTARSARGSAMEAVYRGGGESDVSVKCLGKTTAARWHAMRLELDRQSATEEGLRSRGRIGLSTLYSTAADRGAAGLTAVVETQPARHFGAAVRGIREIAEQIENDRRFGAFVLSDEERIVKACGQALPALEARAEASHRTALEQESKVFERAPSKSEAAAIEGVAGAEAFLRALAGDQVEQGAQSEAMVLHARMRESMELLRTARWWNLTAPAQPVSSLPSSKRARERGERMQKKANDSTRPAVVRDRFYADAETYFEFGGFEAEARAVAAERARLEPVLDANRRRGETALERAAEEVGKDVESLREAGERMKKSTEEKREFEKEADAMEAELGF